MAAKYPKGTVVHQVVTVISGNVMSYQVDQETGDIMYLVESKDAEGVSHTRYFREAEIAPEATVNQVTVPVFDASPAAAPAP